MRSAPCLRLALAAPLALSIAAAGQLQPSSRIVVLAPDDSDPRLELLSDALAYWNDTFRQLGLTPVLQETQVIVAPPETRTFENYAWQVSRGAGRHPPGLPRPDPPPELSEIDAEVVVLLSRQKLMPFAWPSDDRPSDDTRGSDPARIEPSPRRRYFVAIPSLDDPADPTNDARNVIAHELGHALGLSHHGDPTTLMCMPCQLEHLEAGTEPTYLELAPRDRARLAQLYSRIGE